MATYRCDLACVWPSEVALAYMADFGHAATWDPGVAGSRRVDTGPIVVGSAFDLDVRTRGSATMAMRYVVGTLSDASVTLEATTKRLSSIDTISVSPAPTGCVVTYTARLRLLGVAAVLNPLAGAMLRRIGDRARDRLSAVLAAPDPPA